MVDRGAGGAGPRPRAGPRPAPGCRAGRAPRQPRASRSAPSSSHSAQRIAQQGVRGAPAGPTPASTRCAPPRPRPRARRGPAGPPGTSGPGATRISFSWALSGRRRRSRWPSTASRSAAACQAGPSGERGPRHHLGSRPRRAPSVGSAIVRRRHRSEQPGRQRTSPTSRTTCPPGSRRSGRSRRLDGEYLRATANALVLMPARTASIRIARSWPTASRTAARSPASRCRRDGGRGATRAGG